MRFIKVTLLELSFLQGFNLLTSCDSIWPLSTKNDEDYLLNVSHPHAKYETHQSSPAWNIMFNKILNYWPLVTANDLWPPQKTARIIYWMWATYMSSMRSLEFSLHEIQCLQSFNLLTSDDHKRPLTVTKTTGIIYSISGNYMPSIKVIPFLRCHVYKQSVTYTHTQLNTMA